MEFKEYLKKCRTEKHMTQNDVARRLGYEAYVISNWEQGRSEPSLNDLRKLSYVLEVTTDELLDMEIFKYKFMTEEKNKNKNI